MSTDKTIDTNALAQRAENVRAALSEQGFDTKFDDQIRGKLLAERAVDLSDDELERVFEKAVLSDFCIKYAKAARESGLTMEDLYAQDTAAHNGVTAEQRDWIDVLHYETGMNNAEAMQFADKLHDLAAKHFKLCHISLNAPLSPQQSSGHDQIEREIKAMVSGLKGVVDARFVYDPRDTTTTVGLKFESGRHNSFARGGMYKVPLAEGAVMKLDGVAFWDMHQNQSNWVVMRINETDNAAFRDIGREAEVARIMKEAAGRVSEMSSINDVDFRLKDINGNSVGELKLMRGEPLDEMPSGSVRLRVELGNAAFEDDACGEVARIMRAAADQIEQGRHSFPVHDSNGNKVGGLGMLDLPSLVNDGRLSMEDALLHGRVYLAEDSHSGIAEGEYRYIVPTTEYDPGYGDAGGEVWLVNAKGEIAAGYEDGKYVREVQLNDLPDDHARDVRAVAKGQVSLEDHERKYGDDDDLEP
jgi:hypothetical protein